MNIKAGTSSFSRKALDGLSELAQQWGAKGLLSIRITDKGWQSSLAKSFDDKIKIAVNQILGAEPGDLILVVADRRPIANEVLGQLRLDVAQRLGFIRDQEFAFVWVNRFPLLEYNEAEQRLESVHHPFTAPLDEDLPLLSKHPEKVRARSYDLVLNGTEIGGGSVRIHNPDMQQKMFKILGIPPDKAELKFGFLLEALRYGAPPHAGMALGFDRLVAILLGISSIREIIAFPKTTSATCLMTDAPSRVDETQLEELALRLMEKPLSA
jgi:aspartyl-tRNA synthetase